MKSISTTGLLWVFSRGSRWKLGLSIFLSVVLAVAEILAFSAVVPLAQILSGVDIADSAALRVLADIYQTRDEQRLVTWVCVSMLILFVIKGACGLVVRWWILGFIYGEEAKLSEELITYYAEEDLEFHLANRSGELLRNLNESVSHTFVFGVVGLVGFLSELTFVLCVAIILVIVAPLPMGIFLVYVGAATYAIMIYIRPRARKCGVQMANSSAEIYQRGGDVLRGFREVYLRNAEQHMVGKYMSARRESTEAHRRAGFLAEAPRYLLEMVFVTGVGLFAGTLLATADIEAAFPLLAFVVLIGFRLMPTLSRMLSSASLIRIGLPALETVKPHLAKARSWTPRRLSSTSVTPLDIQQGILVSDTHYRYPDAQTEALKGIDLFMPFGTSTALVGRSGSGKSTLADIVCGLLRPSSGTVTADGVDISLNPARWNATLGVVSQNTYVLDASIRDNVAFGVSPEHISDARVRDALEQAGLDDFVKMLPLGLDSVIGEDGASLSGGQRQRIGLARAFYSQPGFLILDEATSALDSKTEAQVTDALATLQGRVTTLVIAHRLSTVQKCDQIVYLEEGKALHIGSFEAIRDASHDFAEMIRLGSVDAAASTL